MIILPYRIVKALLIVLGSLFTNKTFINVDATSQVITYEADFVDFEVANFLDYNQIFNSFTSGQYNEINASVNVGYFMNTNNPAVNLTCNLILRYALNGGAQTTIYTSPAELVPPTTAQNFFNIDFNLKNLDLINANILPYIINNDNNYVNFYMRLQFNQNASTNGYVLTINKFEPLIEYAINYDTIYLFNNFLSHTKYNGLTTTGFSVGTTTNNVKLDFIYANTILTNQYYGVFNTSELDAGLLEKRYAVNIPNVNFIGDRIGAQISNNLTGTITRTLTGSGTALLTQDFRIYYLNGGAQTITPPALPLFNLDYLDCGSLLALNVGCYLNNALAWVVNDAPIISEGLTLVNQGIEFIGLGLYQLQLFEPSYSVVLWVLVGGLGLLALRWALKNDE